MQFLIRQLNILHTSAWICMEPKPEFQKVIVSIQEYGIQKYRFDQNNEANY